MTWLVWGRKSTYRVLVERSEGRRLLGRPTRGWENNIKVGLQKMR